MAFRVELTVRAQRDLANIYAYIEADTRDQAFQWFSQLEEAILSLEHKPERGTATRENRRLRQLLFGNKPHVYRIIYTVRKSSRLVTVLHIRHGSREDFTRVERS